MSKKYDEVFNKEEFETMVNEYTNSIKNFISDKYNFDLEIKNE